MLYFSIALVIIVILIIYKPPVITIYHKYEHIPAPSEDYEELKKKLEDLKDSATIPSAFEATINDILGVSDNGR